MAADTEDCICVCRRVSDDWGFDNVFMSPSDKWLPPGGGLTFKWGAGENIEPQHTAVSGYAGAGQRGTACTRTKTLKATTNTQLQSTHTQTHSSANTETLMWRKENGVRCGNSWRPGGESESRREFVGVQNQQPLLRVYINSPSSPLLRLEQYLFKQYRAAPSACQVQLPRQNWVVAFQSLTQKQKHMMGGERQCSQV